MALTGLTMANRAQAQIGWTLDQCKAKYGEPIGSDKVQMWTFNVNGFKIEFWFNWIHQSVEIPLAEITVSQIKFNPETPITVAQAKQILAKVSSTTWKRNHDGSDDEADAWETRMSTPPKHDISAYLYFAPPALLSSTEPDRSHIQTILVLDDTVSEQDSKEGAQEQADQKAKEEKKVQENVDGL